MNERKKDDILGSRQSIKMDLLFFKDDILKDTRSIQKSLDIKYMKTEDNLNLKINSFESKINLFEQKIFELSNKINTDNKIRENVETLIQFREEISDILLKRRVKYNEFEKKMNEEINRFNDILLDSVIYPGIIGGSARFKTFHEFMDYTLEELGQCKIFRDKSGLDIAPFKKKIDQSIDAIRLQMINMNNGTKEYASTSIEQCEERIKNLLKIYDDRLQDSRVENSHYSIGIEKKTEELKKEISNLKIFQENIKKQYENQKKENELKNYDNDIKGINNRLNKMNLLLKDLLSVFGMKMPKEKKNKIYSGVKQYINGYLNADELFNVKKFHFQKSKTKRYEDFSFGQSIKRTETEVSKKERNDSNIKSNSTNTNKKEPLKRLLSQNSLKLKIQNNEDINEISRTETLVNKNKLEKENNNIKLNEEKTLNKRKSCNYNNLSSLKKYNNEIENEQNNKNKNTIENKITNDQQKSNKKLKFYSSSDSDSNNNEKESILNLSKESLLSKKKKNPFIIKEEDENNISEKSSIKIKEEIEKNINKESEMNNDKITFQNINNKRKIINYNYSKSNAINICIIPKVKHEKIINMKKELSRNIIGKNNENNYIEKKIKNEERTKNKENNNTNNNTHNAKIGLNILNNNRNNTRKYILGINNCENEEHINNIRSKSSKKRNLNNNSIFLNDNYKSSIRKEKRDIYDSFNLPYNHISFYNNTSNFIRNNNLYQNYPKINNENLKLQSIPNYKNNKVYTNKNKSAYNRQKKLRLGNPESPFNSVYTKENKRISNNKSFRIGNERAIEAREIENMFINLQSYISSYEPNLNKDIIFKNLKSQKNQNK